MRRLTIPAVLVVAAVAAIAIAGCGGSSTSATSSDHSAGAAAQGGGQAAVSTRHTSLGTVLVDSRGRTLYLFENDKGMTSTCNGGCAQAWPPLTTGTKATASGSAQAAKLGTSKRSDGTLMVTYGGHPLYTYSGDTRPGDTNGQGLDQFGAEWYVLAPSGKKIDSD
jgi:predicted lipoprotein with Yx(FWY)xxD motif